MQIKVKIIDICYPLSSNNLGVSAQWVKWKCEQAGLPFDDLSPNIVLVSSVHPLDHTKLTGIKKKYPCASIIVGGAGALSPCSYMEHADAVCVGDGSTFLTNLSSYGLDKALALGNVLTKDKATVEVDNTFNYTCPAFKSEDGYTRFILGKGCRHKCLFCQTSWATEYSEHSHPDRLIRSIGRAQGKFGYISNDVSQHSFSKHLPASADGSFSVDFLRKNGLPGQRQIRLGVEGPSQRLRKFVNKPISTEDLVNCSSWLNRNGKSVRWFMIAGLPTECDDDYTELKDAVQTWKRITPKGKLELSFTAWCPDPATPLAVVPIDDSYYARFEEFKSWFFDGPGWTNKVRLLNPRGIVSRAKYATESLCCKEEDLYKAGPKGDNMRIVKYPHQVIRESAHRRLTEWQK